jgi:hypothetical protein
VGFTGTIRRHYFWIAADIFFASISCLIPRLDSTIGVSILSLDSRTTQAVEYDLKKCVYSFVLLGCLLVEPFESAFTQTRNAIGNDGSSNYAGRGYR